MSLRYALLGFLSTTPASGYNLGRKFADGAGAMWEALPSQIYPELRKLEDLGWVEGVADDSDQLKRRTYHLTPEGRTALQAWVEGEQAEHPPERDAELVRFLFLDRSELGLIRNHAVRHRTHYEARLVHWRGERDAISGGTHERMQDRLATTSAQERGFVTGMKWFAFDGLVRRAEMEVEWANAVLMWLDGLKGSKRNSPLPDGASDAVIGSSRTQARGASIRGSADARGAIRSVTRKNARGS